MHGGAWRATVQRVGHHLATKQQLGEKKKEVGHITDKPQVEGKNGIK